MVLAHGHRAGKMPSSTTARRKESMKYEIKVVPGQFARVEAQTNQICISSPRNTLNTRKNLAFLGLA